jgi:1-acyl-sn-glycerol-3-phosphate acyltransferase
VADAGGAPDDPALIQYTSGSTGDPKGVLLTHANLLANIRATATGIDLRPTDVAASWLPLYHDMGLIGTWLFCVYWGVPLSLQSPLSFLARPERWLWTIHRRRVTLSAAPNFAYELCVRKISAEALEGLELSSWRCALNGAEPVSPDTLARFADRFAPYGFHRDALLPVYGLAECAVALSFPPLGRTPRVDRVARAPFERDGRAEPAGEGEQALRFVSVGMPLAGHDVRVVGDTGSELPERTVGRIVFRGPSVMAGYYHNPAATAAISLPGGWMDSGDLGYRSDGELFVTGRRKDLLIIRGRNLVPQELEEIAGAVEGVRTGCVAAIGVADAAEGTERLVIIAETRSADSAQWSRMESEIVARVAEATGTPPERVVLVAPGTVPKTPSGKIQRSATKARYLAGTLGGQPRLSLRRRVALVEGAALTTAARIARAAARRLARALYAIYLALAFGVGGLVVALPCWALAAAVPSRRLAAALERIAARLALRLAGCRLTVEGVERLPVRGPCVLASNHASHADVPSLLALLPGDVVIVAKQEVLDWPIVGTFVRRVEHPTVDRSAPERGLAAFAEIARRVRAGAAVLFFPEATFTAAAGLRPFRLGAFEVAVATGAPVVPLALRGTRQVLRSGTALPRPGPIHLWIGAPIAPDGEGWEAAVHLRDRVAEAIAAHCGEPRLDLVAAGPVAAPATPSAPRQADRRA